MNSLHYEDVLIVKLHLVTVEISPALLEVEARNLHLAPLEQLVQLLSEKIQVHGTQSLKIILPFLVTRSEFPVHKIVVQLYDLRIQAQDAALDGKTLGCGCFSAA